MILIIKLYMLITSIAAIIDRKLLFDLDISSDIMLYYNAKKKNNEKEREKFPFQG